MWYVSAFSRYVRSHLGVCFRIVVLRLGHVCWLFRSTEHVQKPHLWISVQHLSVAAPIHKNLISLQSAVALHSHIKKYIRLKTQSKK